MDNGVNHILNVTGVLKNFCIAKKIVASELKKIKKLAKDSCSSSDDYTELLKREILKYTDDYVKRNKIPGLITSSDNGLKSFNIKDKKYIKIYKEAAQVAKRLLNGRNLSEKELTFFIMSLVGALNLTQEDFNNFNKEIKESADFEESESWGGFGEYNSDDDDDDDDGPEQNA
jgi:hypothetical protein